MFNIGYQADRIQRFNMAACLSLLLVVYQFGRRFPVPSDLRPLPYPTLSFAPGLRSFLIMRMYTPIFATQPSLSPLFRSIRELLLYVSTTFSAQRSAPSLLIHLCPSRLVAGPFPRHLVSRRIHAPHKRVRGRSQAPRLALGRRS